MSNIIGLKGLALIKEFEGCKLTAYKCSAGVWTIGFGNTFYEDGSAVKKGDTIDQESANILFLKIVEVFVKGVNKLITSEVTQNQFDAMVSLSFNIGLGNFKRSSVLRKVNNKPEDVHSIGESFLLWNKAGGNILNGLVRRRIAEVKLFLTID